MHVARFFEGVQLLGADSYTCFLSSPLLFRARVALPRFNGRLRHGGPKAQGNWPSPRLFRGADRGVEASVRIAGAGTGTNKWVRYGYRTTCSLCIYIYMNIV